MDDDYGSFSIQAAEEIHDVDLEVKILDIDNNTLEDFLLIHSKDNKELYSKTSLWLCLHCLLLNISSEVMKLVQKNSWDWTWSGYDCMQKGCG